MPKRMESAELQIHPLHVVDCAVIAQAYSDLGGEKLLEQTMRYLEEQQAGKRAVLVAWLGQDFAGYLTILWESAHPPLRKEGVPEILDLNVLPAFRRLGIATALLEEAEGLIAQRKDAVGVGMPMTADSTAAQRLFSQRGYLLEGSGLYSHGYPVKQGEQVPVDDELRLYFVRDIT